MLMKKKLLLALLSLLLLPLGVIAQTVEIDLQYGSLVRAVTDENETGFGAGFTSLWRHEQLSLSMTGTDRDALTSTGEIAEPSSVFGDHNGEITIVGGRRPSYIVLSLPKGYRITGYELKLANDLGSGIFSGNFANLNSNQEAASSNGYGTMRFYETKAWETGGTNSTSTGRTNGKGYDEDQVRYIELGTDWENGQIGTAASDVLATAREDGNNDNETNFNIKTNEKGKTFTIARTSQSDDDMGNQIYFRLVKDYCFYGLTIKSFKIQFTAEGTFAADVVPQSIGQARSVVGAPFKTNKIDIGEVSMQTQPGTNNTLFSYSWDNVEDLDAYNYLYQANAVQDGVPAEGNEAKHIYPVEVDGNKLYALCSDTYYIETPTEILNKHGSRVPIGYRIVGALFNYLWGSETPGQHIDDATLYYITYESGGTTYYLNDQGRFTINKTTTWETDNNGNVHSANIYLGCSSGNNNNTTLTAAANAQNRLSIDNQNRLYYRRANGNLLYLHGSTNATTAPNVQNNTNGLAAWTEETEAGYDVPSFTPGPYKLKVWNREGTAVKETIEVNSAADAGVYDMGLCNNDAIKFEIEVEEGHQALVNVTLLLQALDPYIDKMDIVCHDENNVLELTQSFTADNFSVSGGKFIFYVPEDYGDKDLTFTFSDLYSKYGDETYYSGGHGSARYSFVTSPYFSAFDGVAGNKILPTKPAETLSWNNDATDIGLYDTRYTTNQDGNQAGATIPSTHKVYTSTAGNVRFKFNNAKDVSDGIADNLEEYAFSVAKYLDNYSDPDAAAGTTPETGEFIPCILNASSETQKSDVFFVFTADETRWNIAPTTALQHRFYAFYRMEIEVVARTFTPDFTWVPIYDSTSFAEDGEEKDDSMWGLVLDVEDTDNGNKVQGYLTYQEIINHIVGRGEEGDANYIPSKLDPTNENGPATVKQILYIDGTPLYAMINSAEDQQIITLEDLQEVLPANALVFLPENTTSTLDNVAYIEGESFHAGKDIVLTDKQPFYTPYDIQVDAANYATYERKVTVDKNGKVTSATVMLPFALTLDGNGVHTNPSGTASGVTYPGDGLKFTVNQLGSNVISKPENGYDYDHEGVAYFTPLTGEGATAANMPYMIKVTDSPSDKDVSFVATQKGAYITKTPDGTTANNHTGEIIAGLATNGVTFDGATVNFVNNASYSGLRFNRDDKNIFYFASNQYLNMNELVASRPYLYVYPFRGIYSYSSSNSGSGESRQFLLKRFSISYEKPETDLEGTGIDDSKNEADLMIRSGKGYMTISASKAQEVTIYSVNGACVAKANMLGGDTQTVNLPTGLYLVNNVKIAVK